MMVLTIGAVLLIIVQAVASPSQMRDLVQELFADVALEVDDRAKGETPVIFWCMFLYLCPLLGST